MNTYAANAQSRTLAEAENNGEGWTQFEIDMLIEYTDKETDETLALTLGRTLWAVVAKQYELRNGRRAQGTAVKTRQRVELSYDRGFTDISAWERMYE